MIMISQPQVVTDIILSALAQTSGSQPVGATSAAPA